MQHVRMTHGLWSPKSSYILHPCMAACAAPQSPALARLEFERAVTGRAARVPIEPSVVPGCARARARACVCCVRAVCVLCMPQSAEGRRWRRHGAHSAGRRPVGRLPARHPVQSAGRSESLGGTLSLSTPVAQRRGGVGGSRKPLRERRRSCARLGLGLRLGLRLGLGLGLGVGVGVGLASGFSLPQCQGKG